MYVLPENTELIVESQDDGVDEPEGRPVQECGFHQ